MLAVFALLVAHQASAIQATALDVGERLRAIDVLWAETPALDRRIAASPLIQEGVVFAGAGRNSEACEFLDKAAAELSGGEVSAGDAVTLRFSSPVVEPGKSAELKLGWAYLPSKPDAVSVAVAGRTVQLLPGRSVTVEVNPAWGEPDLALTPEIGYAVPTTVGTKSRTAYLTILKGGRQRIDTLSRATDPQARDLGLELQRLLAEPLTWTHETPILDWVYVGEQLDQGRKKLSELARLPFARHKQTVFRAEFPRQARGKTPPPDPQVVLIAVPGPTGGESSFFESYGRGRVALEAERRGWVFVSVRSSPSALEDALEWLQQVRGIRIRHLVVMGHGQGAGVALSAASLPIKPAAAAILAPNQASFLREWIELPLYLSVGLGDGGRLRASVESLAREIGERPDFRFDQIPNCEHFTVVAESIPAVFEFFDRFVPPVLPEPDPDGGESCSIPSSGLDS
ncbi:MAG: hypothetical protein AMXMBFR19_11680 [Chthonomonadaceae bacterium]|uniref:Alpha/beta hydrolase family n=1 Tax=Candidatus Nitrosymbiomonas proteolyticus TaxID=2608984 RepID=A0A809RB01_9BACT|nr:alpha/beta hydrolase family [Candidatus Nitrosymbiomonas proteolyticus]